jgi:chitinase
MGGSWSGDPNNCWDYCFGREEELSTSLVNIVYNQQLDGIDIDYEYCYDIAGQQAGKCSQSHSILYSDANAQTFLDTLTSKLRTKLDALQTSNGYNRGRYILTHAPMDGDLTPSTSAYFQILKARRADLDFLMPQFYNGVTRPAVDGVAGTGSGAMSAAVIFSSLSNDLFDFQPSKVSDETY